MKIDIVGRHGQRGLLTFSFLWSEGKTWKAGWVDVYVRDELVLARLHVSSTQFEVSLLERYVKAYPKITCTYCEDRLGNNAGMSAKLFASEAQEPRALVDIPLIHKPRGSR